MKITMIVPYFKPDITAIVHLMDDLARDLGQYGAQVTVITGFPSRGVGEEARKDCLNRRVEILAGNLHVLRIGSKKIEGSGFLIRGLRYVGKALSFYRTARRIPSDVYFIYSTPPVLGVIGAWLSRKAPTLYCLQDIFPDNLAAAQGRISRIGFIIKAFRLMESYSYRRNTHIVTISTDMKKNLLSKGVKENKISVIGNWIDVEKIRYIPRAENFFFDRFHLDREAFYVSYSGNLGHAQDMDIILNCAQETFTEEPAIRYIIVGSGVCETRIRKRIAEYRLTNISIYPLQPEEYSSYIYSLGDIGLITMKKNMHGYAMPSKTWTMMSAAQPIICTAEQDSQLSNVIITSESGLVVEPGDSQEMAKLIINLYHNQFRLKTYGEKGRNYAEKNLSREQATKEYFRLLLKLIESRG